jgi:pimeloyl-ACP methyl ester carboxylesterase
MMAVVALPAGGVARAAPQDTLVHTVQVGHISIAYREVGHGRPLLLIQGSGAAMDVWDPLMIATLAEHHRVIEFDNRGVGFSTDDQSQPMTIDLLADDAAGLIRALHLGRPDVLGWSLGGFIAEDLAARHLELVRRLVLVSSDPGGTHAVRAAPDVLALDARVTLGLATLDEILYLLFPPESLNAGLAWLDRYFSQPGCCESVAYATGLRQLDAESGWYTPDGGVWDALPDPRRNARHGRVQGHRRACPERSTAGEKDLGCDVAPVRPYGPRATSAASDRRRECCGPIPACRLTARCRSSAVETNGVVPTAPSEPIFPAMITRAR